ncbi:unnamed protein product, partial [Ixodes pacificus]
EPPKASIELLTQQLHEAKTAATKGLRVSQDHPDPDRHLLALWNHRLRLLAAYRKRGKQRRTKRRLRKIQNEIERYTSGLRSNGCRIASRSADILISLRCGAFCVRFSANVRR